MLLNLYLIAENSPLINNETSPEDEALLHMSIDNMIGAAGPITDSPTFDPDVMDLDVDLAQNFMEEVVVTVQDNRAILNNSRDPQKLLEAISKPPLTPRLTNMVKNNLAATTTVSTNPSLTLPKSNLKRPAPKLRTTISK